MFHVTQIHIWSEHTQSLHSSRCSHNNVRRLLRILEKSTILTNRRTSKNTAVRTSLMYLVNRSYSLLIWKANSRLWQRTTPISLLSVLTCWRVANTNTAVFPIPFASTNQVIPRSEWGMHWYEPRKDMNPQSVTAFKSSGFNTNSWMWNCKIPT